MKTTYILMLCFALAGCASATKDNPRKISEQRQLVRDELSGEISLKADRHQLDDLRKDVPADKKAANDELAFSLDQTADVKEEPSRIRERFQNLVEKKRHRFDAKVQKIRKNYQKEETARRDQFVKEQNKKRDGFKSKKRPADESREFYSQLDKDRLEFFSKERERRGDFDDEIHQQTKDFNEYMKSKYDEFTEQMRVYSQRFSDAKKNKTIQHADPMMGAPGDGPAPPPMDQENPKLPEPPYGH